MSAASRVRPLLVVAAALSILSVLFVPSCGGPQRSQEPAAQPPPVSGMDSHGLHIVNNNRLREIMRRLGDMKFDDMAIEMEGGGPVSRDVCELSKLAAELSSDAQVIPLLLKDMEMNDESRRVMNTLSGRLHEEATELKHFADANNVHMIKYKLDEMVATCNACHASFRAPAVAQSVDGSADVLVMFSPRR